MSYLKSLNPMLFKNKAHVWSFKYIVFVYFQDVQDVRKMCARCVKDVCKMCVRCVQVVRKMWARCAQYVWKMYAYVMFDIIEPHEFRKYSTCWVLEKSEEPCRILKKFECVVNVIHAKVLPGSVRYIEH